MKIYGAYVHARPDGRIFYVGKGTETRARNFNRNPHHGNVVKKHGEKNILVGFMPCSSEATALELEIGLIKCLRRSGIILTNKTDGGDGVSGLRHSDESREKMSESRKQLWGDPDHQQKMSAAHKGQVLSADNLAKLIAANKGKSRSVATREKISASQKGKQIPAEQRAKISAAQKGRKLPAAHCKKIGVGVKACWESQEFREKMKIAHSNREPVSEATRAKLSAAWKNRAPLSAESLANIRAAAQRREVKKRQSKESK